MLFEKKIGRMLETRSRGLVSLTPGFSPVWVATKIFEPF
jgi:hypothetical protein